jgi:mannitol-specific phosphotransferase system IIBC component
MWINEQVELDLNSFTKSSLKSDMAETGAGKLIREYRRYLQTAIGDLGYQIEMDITMVEEALCVRPLSSVSHKLYRDMLERLEVNLDNAFSVQVNVYIATAYSVRLTTLFMPFSQLITQIESVNLRCIDPFLFQKATSPNDELEKSRSRATQPLRHVRT